MSPAARCLLSSLCTGTGIKPTKSPPKIPSFESALFGLCGCGEQRSKHKGLMPPRGRWNFHLPEAPFDFGTLNHTCRAWTLFTLQFPSSGFVLFAFKLIKLDCSCPCCVLLHVKTAWVCLHVLLAHVKSSYCTPVLPKHKAVQKYNFFSYRILSIFSLSNLNYCWLWNWD